LQENSDPDLNVSSDENSAYKSSVPKRYKKIDIKLGKMGVDDFDFDSYNKVSIGNILIGIIEMSLVYIFICLDKLLRTGSLVTQFILQCNVADIVFYR
jgi:hypothetical protein